MFTFYFPPLVIPGTKGVTTLADLERVHLLGRVAQMYYEQSATQEAIAASLNISRPTVSRLLKEAREEGVVQIVINSPFRYVSDLEQALLQAFPALKQVRVLQGSDAATVVRAAASFVGSVVQNGDVVGVSWGNTLAEMSEYLQPKPLRDVTVVQLNGGVARAGSGTNAHEIASRFGQAFGADVYRLQVPAIVDSPEVRDVMLQNRETARVLELGRGVNVAIYGIGAPERNSVLVQAGYFDPNYLEGLRARGAVGDICSRYFTAEGSICDPDLDDRTIGIPLRLLGQAEQAIAVLYGAHKATGALGALRGGFLNVMVLDEVTAREVLRLQGEGCMPV